MKRIEFIAPVESMRGNLGEKQNLVYNPNNNRAFDSIEGQLNPALNYEPRLIAAKGRRNYFSVKTKSSVHLTQRAKAVMANLGGVGAIYSALVSDKSDMVYINAYSCYQDMVAKGYTGTFRKFMYGYIQAALDAKDPQIIITTDAHVAYIDNPWVKNQDLNLWINQVSLVKFWKNLCDKPVIIHVGNKIAIGWLDSDTLNIITNESGYYNVLGFEMDRSGYFTYNGLYMKYDGEFVNDSITLDRSDYVWEIVNVTPYD